MINIRPGEPVPPGFEDEVKRVAEIEKVIQNYKGNALIGLEYTIELQEVGRVEPYYQCVLCDRRGDPRTIMQHWTSFAHRLNYLERHYPSIVSELEPVRNKMEKMKKLVNLVSEAIERHYGRMALCVFDADEYRRSKTKMCEEVKKKFHHDERNGPNFLDAIDRTLLQESFQQKKEGKSSAEGLDEISSDSDGAHTNRKTKSKNEQSPAYRMVPTGKQSSPNVKPEETNERERNVKFPTPRELSLQASHIAQERYKWEKYRCLLELYLKQIEAEQKDYEKNPEKHPKYPEEWKAFWNKRYKELQKEKKVDPNKYDYRPEWAVFWSKRRQELYSEDIEKKKKEIKLKLELPEDAEEKVDKLKEKYKVQTGNKSAEQNKTAVRARGEPKVIDISDDDDPPRHSPKGRRSNSRTLTTRRSRSKSPRSSRYQKRPRIRTKSRSISPFSDDYEYESRHQYERGLFQSRNRGGHPPPQSSSRRYPQSTTADSDYYELKQSNYKQSRYSGHYRNGQETFPSHSRYGSMSPPLMKSKKEFEPEPEPEIEGPLTVVAVLRLLTALEDSLGSLGPKMIDLLGKALALENVQANSADDLLMNDDNCVFFETAKEKLKGLLIAEVIEDPQKIRAVKKAIRNIAAIIHQVSTKSKSVEKNKLDEPIAIASTSSAGMEISHSNRNKNNVTIKDLPFDRQLVASKLAAALVIQGREDLSTEDVDKLIYFLLLMVKLSKVECKKLHLRDIAKDINLPINMPSTSKPARVKISNFTENAFESEVVDADASNDTTDKGAKNDGSNSLESLTDSDLQTLLQNFKHLSTEEQHHLIAHLKKLETSDPLRVEKLRKFVNLNDLVDAADTADVATTSSHRLRTDASSSSVNSNRGGSSSKRFEDSSPLHSISRDRTHISDDEESIGRRRGVTVGNPNKFSLDDEDDDDYNFEDVLKVASNIVENNKRRSKTNDSSKSTGSSSSRNDSQVEPQTSSSTSKATADSLAFNRAAMNINLNDTQNLIANLMGNIQQNNATNKKLEHSAELKTAQPVQSILSTQTQNQSQNQRPTNIPYYQQQQQTYAQHPQYSQQQQQQHQQVQQQNPYGGNNAYNQMGYNQAAYYNSQQMPGYNNAYQAYPQQAQQPWAHNQQPHPSQSMGYNMYGGN